MKSPAASRLGDLWGGVAAMLVALPASLAFGVAVHGPLAGAGAGALAGLLGAVVLGIIAPLAGGTPRLITAPCAPAVAVLNAFALQAAAAHPGDPSRVLVAMSLAALIAALVQLSLGAVRAGTVIQYIPYPVVTGYLSGVAVVIFLKQLPSLLGLGAGVALAQGLSAPSQWQLPAMIVGAATVLGMVLAPRITRSVPSAIIGLTAGIIAYGAIAVARPELRALEGNALVIGSLGTGSGADLAAATLARLRALSGLSRADLREVLSTGLTLAVVLSLDTLKTCVLVDAMTGSQHDSNRELLGQGAANLVSATLGGMPGAGTSGPTLVAIASGAQTRWAGVIEGALVLVTFVALAPAVAWAPLAALAGILAVVAVKMFDFSVLAWATRQATALDFAVVLVVIAVAVGVNLIAASGVGVALSILLFIRNESRAPVVRRRLSGAEVFSKRRRSPAQVELLARRGDDTLVLELQGSLFFGTTDQIRASLSRDLDTRGTIIFDLRRVDAVDLTAVHILAQMRERLRQRGAALLLCHLPRGFAGHEDAARFLREAGLVDEGPDAPTMLFAQRSDALAWAEDRLLAAEDLGTPDEAPLDITEMTMFQGRKPETLAALSEAIEARAVAEGDAVFRCGDEGDELFFVRRGSVRVSIPVGEERLHVASFGRGDFFGEIVFLDGGARSADAVAETATELFVLSRKRFDALAAAHPRLGQGLFASLARVIALRLRRADAEIAALDES